MTSLLSLPQLSGSFSIVNNADWLDVIQFPAVNSVTPDLTGIDFLATVRPSVGSSVVLFSMSTVNGTLINGGPAGTIKFNVPTLMLLGLAAQSAVFDMIATDETGTRINLFSGSGPAQLLITQGCTVDLFDAIIAYLEWVLPSLPTTPPQVSDVLWINNGVLCVSPISETLPTSAPMLPGQLWSNGGFLSITPGSQLQTYPPAVRGLFWQDSNGFVRVS